MYAIRSYYVSFRLPEAGEQESTSGASAGGGPAGSMVMENALVAVALAESVTCTVKENVPEAVGVPDITPESDNESHDNPAERPPMMLHA